jgi:RNA-directed DNA polymerase
LKECKLEMHPEKSGIVYCKDSLRRQDYPRISFTFLGYEFRPRSARKRDGKIWTSFLPAISASAMKRIGQTIREWKLPRQTTGVVGAAQVPQISGKANAGASLA